MDDDEEFEIDLDLIVPAIALDNDAIASVVMEYAADQATAAAKLLNSLSLAWAGQFRKNVADIAMHEEVTREIETLPTTNEE